MKDISYIFDSVDEYIDKKLISEGVHPEDENVRIYNYTHKCQFEGAWDDVTRVCRGLIVNRKTREVLARPFPKFFNYEELINKGEEIPDEAPVVTEKMDGSLGILYFLNGEPWVATRGSFVSDQAKWATRWYRENVSLPEHQKEKIAGKVSDLFEIIYPENRIVVKYDFSGLVHLASIDIETGEDVERDVLMRKPRVIPYTSLDEIKNLDEPNSEGFVLYYPKAGLRMKIKFSEYVRLHKIMTGLSEKGVWEHLKDGGDIDEFAKDTPDEFYRWLIGVKNRLLNEHRKIVVEADREYRSAKELACSREELNVGDEVPRKAIALAIQETMAHPSLGFDMYDGKPINEKVWKLIKPRGEGAFRVDPDL